MKGFGKNPLCGTAALEELWPPSNEGFII